MELDQLRTFLAVIEHGSFTRAARSLHLGQSTVSFHVKALETSVGARLLDRSGGRVTPTESGRALRRYAERIVALRREALALLQAQETGVAGTLRIAASTIPAEYVLPAVLGAYRRRMPGVHVEVRVLDSARATASLLAQESDIAVVGAHPGDRRLTATVIADDEVVLVGAAGTPFVARTQLEIEELARMPLVLREEGSGTREAVAELLARAGVPAVDCAPLVVGSTEAARRCALQGLGLTFISRRAVDGDLAAGHLVLIDMVGLPVRRSFWVVYPRTAELPPAAAAMLEILDGDDAPQRTP